MNPLDSHETGGIVSRIDAITKIPDTHRFAKPPAPKAVKIELTGRCNYRCGFCALRMREVQPKHDMDLNLFKRITLEMRAAGVNEIGLFFLGESFMAPELLLEALKWVKTSLRFPYVFLTSNASLADPEELEPLFAAGLDSLKWSMNAADEQQFKEIMAVSPKYFRKALRNVKEAKRIRDAGNYATRLYASSIKYDGEQQAKMEAMLAENVLPYVDQHYWLPLYSMGAVATQREAELGYRPTAGNQGRLGALREPLPCWSAFSEGHVTADGYLSACCFDADGRFKMADLNQVSFMEGWNSSVFQELRAAHLKRDVSGTICEDCIAYRG
jgi:MoaA/NifB/PqqE/SkfB family radical SAM enzyme